MTDDDSIAAALRKSLGPTIGATKEVAYERGICWAKESYSRNKIGI